MHIGFDKPLNADFNLDSAAYRLQGLKDANVVVRSAPRSFSLISRSTDAASIQRPNCGFDDPDLPVRS